MSDSVVTDFNGVSKSINKDNMGVDAFCDALELLVESVEEGDLYIALNNVISDLRTIHGK